MIKRIIFCFLVFLLLISSSFGQVDSNSLQNMNNSEIDRNLEILKNNYNQNLEKIPDFIKNNFGNSRADLHITYYSNEVVIGIVTEKAYMTEIKYGNIENHTMDIK